MTTWFSYDNGSVADCFIAAVGNVMRMQGVDPIPEATVIKDFTHWCGDSGCKAFLTLLNIVLNGLHGKRIRSFGMLARNETELKWAIGRWSGFIAGVNGGHEVAVGKDPETGQIVTVAQLVAGQQLPVDWPSLVKSLDSDTIAIAPPGTFDPLLPLLALKNNPVWWLFGVLALIYLGLLAPKIVALSVGIPVVLAFVAAFGLGVLIRMGKV